MFGKRPIYYSCLLLILVGLYTQPSYSASTASLKTGAKENKFSPATPTTHSGLEVHPQNFSFTPYFVPKIGQMDSNAQFELHLPGQEILFAVNQVELTVAPQTSFAPLASTASSPSERPEQVLSHPPSAAVQIQFQGVNPSAIITGTTLLPGKVNSYLGNDPANWQTNLPTYAAIEYQNLYPGIHLSYQASQSGLKGTYTVAPGANPALIQWRYQGADSVSLDEEGNLQISLTTEQLDPYVITESAPIAWQEINNQLVPISATYQLQPDGVVSFVVADYNPNFPLTIDPTIIYQTTIPNSHMGLGMSIDGSGQVYVVSRAPGHGVDDVGDVLVSKFNYEGNLVFETTYGGIEWDTGFDLVVGSNGNIYVTGETGSADFPTSGGPLQSAYGGGTWDAVFSILNPSGQLIYSSYLGGEGDDYGYGIALNNVNDIYIAGSTTSNASSFPITANVYDPSCGSDGGCDFNWSTQDYTADGFVVKLSANNLAGPPLYGTYLGHSQWEVGVDITVNNVGEAYVLGVTASPSFPVSGNAAQPVLGGGNDWFVSKLSADGQLLAYSTFLGGSGDELPGGVFGCAGLGSYYDYCGGIALDSAANIYVTGGTTSADFPTQNAYDSTLNGVSDGIVAKYTPAGVLAYATYLGGSGDDAGFGIAVADTDDIYLTGYTDSTNFPEASVPYNGLDDIFVARLTPIGNDHLVFSSYLGSSDNDLGAAVAVDSVNAIYLTGGWGYNAFVNKLTQSGLVLTVTDANGNDVTISGLGVNEEGWPSPNPITVRAIVHNGTTETINSPFTLDVTFGAENGRFYPLETFDSSPIGTCSDNLFLEEPSYSTLQFSCDTLVVLPGETVEFWWQLWIQPSAADTLNAIATYNSNTASQTVTIPQATIHPVVFIYGILGSMPPAQYLWQERPPNWTNNLPSWGDGPALDPFLLSYYPLLDHLENIGYEWGKSLFALTYDWRDSNDVSAKFLDEKLDYIRGLSSPIYISNSQSDLVVHSMGGLVSRAYIQDKETSDNDRVFYDDDVNKVIFIASPHQGFAATYRTYEGLTWDDYLEHEVWFYQDGTLMNTLMDHYLWPHFIEERYNPTRDEKNQGCISYRPDGEIIVDCKPIYYDWTHTPMPTNPNAPHRGIYSLPQMLPTSNLAATYLYSSNGIPWSCPGDEVLENEWLEELNSNINNLVTHLEENVGDSGLDDIYVLYSQDFPELTDTSYTVQDRPCGGNILNRWPYGGPTEDREIRSDGDDLIPKESTTLWFSGLLPNLEPSHEQAITQYGHKGIAYSPNTQILITEFLTGYSEVLHTEDYISPALTGNVIRIIAILVNSPVSILVTDPAGQRTGVEPTTGQAVNENPLAFYTGPGEDQFMLLFNTLPGEYTITATGTGNGDYAIETYAITETGEELVDVMTGTVTIDQVITHTTTYTLAGSGSTIFSDDMESGAAHWTAAGSWFLQNNQAHSPVAAWDSGILTITHPVTLTLIAPLNLSLAQQAQATFWHTYTLSHQAHFQVDVSPDGGQTWQTVITRFGGNHNWTPLILNLTSYTGPGYEDVRLRFLLFPATTDDRWLIDDISVLALDVPTSFALPFEDDMEGWHKWAASGDWQTTATTFHSPNHAWQSEVAGGSLTLAGTISITQDVAATLSFWQEMAADGVGWVEVSTDGGQNWVTIHDSFNVVGWQKVVLDLSSYSGQNLSLRFNHFLGGQWAIDDVELYGTPIPTVHSLPFTDDMEAPESNWQGMGGWQPVTTTASSGTTAWWSNTPDSSLLLQGELDLSNAVSPILTFQNQMVLPVGTVGHVNILPEGGTWQTALTITANTSTWTPLSVDLRPYVGQQIKLAFVQSQETSEGVGQQTPARVSLTVADTVTTLPVVIFAIAGISQFLNHAEIRRRAKQGVRWLVVLGGMWIILFPCGLWAYIPLVRPWYINHLSSVSGGNVDVVVSASTHPGTAQLSPESRWLLVACTDPRRGGNCWILIDLENGERQELLIELEKSAVWLEEGLLLGEDDRGHFLMTVPDLEKTRLTEFDSEEVGLESLQELLKQSEKVYGVEVGGGYYLVVLGGGNKYFTWFPYGYGITKTDEETFLATLPQAVIVPDQFRVNNSGPVYSPDGALYAEATDGSKVYMDIFMTATHERVARVYKRAYAPLEVGWSADGTGFYFQMQTGGGVNGVLYPEWPVFVIWLPEETVQAAREAMGNNQSSSLLPRQAALYRAAGQTGLEPGWYIDDVAVAEGTPPTPTPTLPPTATPTATPSLTPTFVVLGGIGLSLVDGKRRSPYLVLCLVGTGLLTTLAGCIQVGPSPDFDYNRLDLTKGEMELIVPAEQKIFDASMSPDGKWLFFMSSTDEDRLERPGYYRHTLIDLEQNQQYDLGISAARRRWVDAEHLAGNGVMLQVSDMVQWPLQGIEPPPGSLGEMATAPHIYAIDGFGSTYALVSTHPDFPYSMATDFGADAGVPNEELAAFLADRPHTIVMRNTSAGHNGHRVYSPDGQYYIEDGPFDDPTHNLTQAGGIIYDAHTDEEVAYGYKYGWNTRFLGWAGDSSGVYIWFSPRSPAGDGLYNRHPIYKILVPGAEKQGLPVPVTITPASSSQHTLPDAAVAWQETDKGVLSHSSAHVSYSGWYIDDVSAIATDPPTPTPTATATPTVTATATDRDRVFE